MEERDGNATATATATTKNEEQKDKKKKREREREREAICKSAGLLRSTNLTHKFVSIKTPSCNFFQLFPNETTRQLMGFISLGRSV